VNKFDKREKREEDKPKRERSQEMAYYLPAILYSYLNWFRPHLNRTNFRYLSGYVVCVLISGGRKTVNQVAKHCFWVDRHLSSWERFMSEYEWDVTGLMKALVGLLVQQLGTSLQIEGSYTAIVDTVLIAKNGKRTAGIQKWKDHSGNADRGEQIRGHHWALLGLLAYHATWQRYLCFPILCQMISGQLNPSLFLVDPNGVAMVASFWDSVLPLIVQLQQFLGEKAPLRIIADAYFSKAPFLNPLMAHNIQVITRLRKDAVGWEDPLPEQRSDAKHGKEWHLADLLTHLPLERLTLRLYGEEVILHCVCTKLWLRHLDRKVKVVIIEGIKEPILLLSTDLLLAPTQIIQLYAARFTIELTIRHLKQDFGFGNYQSFQSITIHRVVHLASLAFSLCHLTQWQAFASDWLPAPSKSVSPLSFSHLRHALKSFMLKRILSAKFGFSSNADLADPLITAIVNFAA
jgi:DDE superfamily endonuclease